jgi:pimeloyl-ACP methyl ester carboxylesterase
MMLSSPAHGVIGALEAMARRADNSGLLVDITVPVLVLAGEEDTLTPPDPTAEWASEIPGSRMESVPQAGHIANLETPERVNELVRSFIEDLTSVT